MENCAEIIQAGFELIKRQEAIVVCVELDEHLTHIGQLLSLGLQVGNDGADTRLERRSLPVGGQVSADV